MVSWTLAFVIITASIVMGAPAFYIIYRIMYNIPIVILRFQGDKRRPMILFTRARKSLLGGVVKLYVRGYRYPVRDFQSQYYYPSKKGKFGALILWEPKPGFLTPSIPTLQKHKKNLPKELHEAHAQLVAYAKQNSVKPVDFRFDEELHKDLLLRAVDDTDIDFMLQEIKRTDSQYMSGWREFMSKYGGHAVVALIAIIGLVGFVIGLDKLPNLVGQCIQAGIEAGNEAGKNILQRAAENVGGTPPA